MSNRLVQPPYLEKTKTKIVMSSCEVLFEFQSPLEISNRLVHPP